MGFRWGHTGGGAWGVPLVSDGFPGLAGGVARAGNPGGDYEHILHLVRGVGTVHLLKVLP